MSPERRYRYGRMRAVRNAPARARKAEAAGAPREHRRSGHRERQDNPAQACVVRTRIRCKVEPGDRMSADEYLRAPFGDRWRKMLLAGEVVALSSSRDDIAPEKQVAYRNLLVDLFLSTSRVPERGSVLPAIAIRVDDANVFMPDLLWYAEGRTPGPVLVSSSLPDIAVSVRTSSTWHYDLGPKKSVYEQQGLPELWLVDTSSSTILVFRRSKPTATRFDLVVELLQGDRLSTPLLPGFSPQLFDLFRG